jgi:hypothetical protein
MGLIVPKHLNETPRFACTLCPATFYADERHAFEHHCLSHTAEELAAHSPRHQAPGLFDPEYEGGDVDWSRWVARHRLADPQGREWHKWGRTGDGKHSSGLGDG